MCWTSEEAHGVPFNRKEMKEAVMSILNTFNFEDYKRSEKYKK